jgi:hypothetical protein
MTSPNPLTAKVNDQQQWFTGIGPVEGLDMIINRVDDESWLEAGLKIGLGSVTVGLEAASFWWDPIGTLLRWAASWVMEKLEPAKRFLDKLAGNPPVIEAYAATWGNVGKLVNETADEIDAAVAKDLGDWQGEASATYRAEIGEKVTALREAAKLCASSGRWTQVISMLVGTVRGIVRELIASLIAWLVKSIGWTVLCGPFGVSEACRTAVLEIARVTNLVVDFVGKLTRSLGNLQARLPDVLGAFNQVAQKLAPKGTRSVPTPRAPAAVKPASAVDDMVRVAEPPPTPTPTARESLAGQIGLGAPAPAKIGAKVPATVKTADGKRVKVIHDGTFEKPGDAAKFLDEHYPMLKDVNAGRSQNNCIDSAVATHHAVDNVLAPAAARTAAPESAEAMVDALVHGRVIKAVEADELIAPTYDSWNSLIREMAQQPEGSRGIVMLWRNEVPGFPADGHAFNVIRDQNGIVFLDGQVGQLGLLETKDIKELRLMIYREGP